MLYLRSQLGARMGIFWDTEWCCQEISSYNIVISLLPLLQSSLLFTHDIMAANVSHSPTLPLSNPTTSYWQLPPDPEFSSYRQAATVPETADTVIIGSGITGACIAHNLLYPELSSSGEKQDAGKIVLLEAREACSGATGRNGICFLLLPMNERC